MYKLKDIKVVHIEMTERCNLACLMCERNQNGGEMNPHLKNRELPLKTLCRTFPPSRVKQLEKVYFSGNYGDPILSNALLPFLQYLKQHNKNISLSVTTNGCSRPSYWWKDLAKVTHSVRFGIDGLSDTHKIYRQGVMWSLVIRNAKSYISAGGNAIWEYLLFDHNKHQVKEANLLADKLGFSNFVIKTPEIEGELSSDGPSLKEYKIKKKYGSFEKFLDQTVIKCKMVKNKEIYISAEGMVLPCHWLAAEMYKWKLPFKSTQIWDVLDKKKLNIKNKTLNQIFDSGIFEDIQNTWSKSTIWEGKLKICSLKCGI